MAGRIYLLNDDNLVAMDEVPYDSELRLQTLLATHPDLLAGEQINSDDPRRWLLVTREMAVPGEDQGPAKWSLDHLFIDQDAVPTLVEVKRSSDSRIRREVVGQMLDYAANAVAYWPIEQIRARFEMRCEAEGTDPDETLEDFLAGADDADAFWKRVKTNLQAGRVRLVFLADAIPVRASPRRRVPESADGPCRGAGGRGQAVRGTRYEDACAASARTDRDGQTEEGVFVTAVPPVG